MRIAIAQAPATEMGAWRETLAGIKRLIAQAAQQGADLVVLPECVWPAYCLGSRSEYESARLGGMPGSEALLDCFHGAANRHHIGICGGYVEEAEEYLYNAACLFDGSGALVGTHRKCFLWDFDHDYFTAGERVEPIDTTFGRVGMMVCADARLPEIAATLAARGAELILQPTAWVNVGTEAEPWNPQADFLIRARAAESGIPIASASKWGEERGATFIGASLICDARGEVLTACAVGQTEVQTAEVRLGTPRRAVLSDATRSVLESNEVVQPGADVGPLRLTGQAYADGGGILSAQSDIEGSESSKVVVLMSGSGGAQVTCAERGGRRPQAFVPESMTEPLRVGQATVASVTSAEAEHFGAIRAWALRGVHLVLVLGCARGTVALRARACENRVFVVGIASEGWCVLAPSGRVLAEHRWGAAGEAMRPVVLPIAQAAQKEVARGTDMLQGRRPEQYLF